MAPEKSEREKMLAGELYLASDSELAAARQRAQRRLYSQTTIDEREWRTQLLQALLGTVGESPQIGPPFHCDYGCHIAIGSKVKSGLKRCSAMSECR